MESKLDRRVASTCTMLSRMDALQDEVLQISRQTVNPGSRDRVEAMQWEVEDLLWLVQQPLEERLVFFHGGA